MNEIDANDREARRPGRPTNAARAAAMAREPARSPTRPAGGIRLMTAENRFDFDKSKTPPGMTCEWRTRSVMGQPAEEQIISDEMNGWVPVPCSRHPELAGRKPKDPSAPIVRGGLMLMERPKELTDEARMLDNVAAHDQVATQLRRLKLDGKERGSQAKVSRKWEEIPDDEPTEE